MMSMHNQHNQIEISELVKSILTIEPLFRKEEDIDKIIEYRSLGHLTFINDILRSKMKNNVKALLKCLKIFYLNTNEEVYKTGDRPKDCFFLLEGALDIFFPEIKRISNTTQFVIKHKIQIKQGEMFGEKELIVPSTARESTVCCTMPCMIGKISKRDYSKIYDITIRRFKQDYLTLFKSSKLFKSKGNAFIEKFVRQMFVKDYKGGEQILYQDRPCDMIYIIKSGSVKVVNEESDESYYSFDYKIGELFGDIEIVLNKGLSQYSIYSGDDACQLFYWQRDAFIKLLGEFMSEFNSLTKNKIEKLKAGIGELTKSRLFSSKSMHQLINIKNNRSRREENDSENQFDLNFNHFDYKNNNISSINEHYESKPKQNTDILYKNKHFFRRPMKSITAISCKIDECQKVKARETIINMVPMPKINSHSKFVSLLQDNKPFNEIYQDEAVNNYSHITSSVDHISPLSRSCTLSSFFSQRNPNKKYTQKKNTEETIQLINSQIKPIPKVFQSQMLRRSSYNQKIQTTREKILSLFCSNRDLLMSNLQ